MRIEESTLPGVLIVTTVMYSDHRGSFQETYNQRKLAAVGIPENWAQDNFSVSHRNVLRGMHYQIDQPQGKLVRVAYGAVFDVAVDLRLSSPYFGKYFGLELTSENGKMLWIPPGFGHGFLVLSETAGFAYKTTDYYSPSGERTLLWNCKEVGIEWPIATSEAVLSDKDRKGKALRDLDVFP